MNKQEEYDIERKENRKRTIKKNKEV